MPNQTPEQREAALKLAKRITFKASNPIEWLFSQSSTKAEGELSRALLSEHAENVKLREALGILASRRAGAQIKAHPSDCMCSVHIAKRALSGSPDTEAGAKDGK